MFRIERGGDITFHGPGQIVVYPILDLNRFVKSVSWYMRTLEKVIINTLSDFNIKAELKDGLLVIALERIIPEEHKEKFIEIK